MKTEGSTAYLERTLRWRLLVGVASVCSRRRGYGLARVLGLLLLGLACPAAAAERPPLQMGVLPYLSSERLFKNFLPMKHYLEAQLGRRVVMSTAPDFRTYIRRAARGDYDIYQTAPHFALLAETEQGYRRLSRFSRDLSGDVIVRRAGRIQHIEDLRGGIVISPDALAITSVLGEQLLQDHGLVAERDYRLLRNSSSHNNALWTVYRGEADAAFTGAAVFESLNPEIKRGLRVLSRTPEVPSMMLMAHSRLSEADYQQLKTALLAFTSAGAGQKFFASTGYQDMAAITDADMARLRPFLKDLKARLK